MIGIVPPGEVTFAGESNRSFPDPLLHGAFSAYGYSRATTS
jgi:hypothetical protein